MKYCGIYSKAIPRINSKIRKDIIKLIKSGFDA